MRHHRDIPRMGVTTDSGLHGWTPIPLRCLDDCSHTQWSKLEVLRGSARSGVAFCQGSRCPGNWCRERKVGDVARVRFGTLTVGTLTVARVPLTKSEPAPHLTKLDPRRTSKPTTQFGVVTEY